MEERKRDVIIALDFPGRAETLAFLDKFQEEDCRLFADQSSLAIDTPKETQPTDSRNLFSSKPFVKIGMELFYAEGPAIVGDIKARGHKVFLDLKLHDIPNTVKMAMKQLAGLGVDMVNVHAAGTIKMMEAALEGLKEGAMEKSKAISLEGEKKVALSGLKEGAEERRSTDLSSPQRPLLIAVTQLTSTDQERMERDLLIKEPIEEVVAHYAANAKAAGLDGVVCSPLESALIHDRAGEDFLTITPGIRLAGDNAQDQKRVTTPAMAKELGSDLIVVGRSITAAPDPVAAYRQCLAEFLE